MNIRHSDDYLVGLVREFCKYPRETKRLTRRTSIEDVIKS